MDWMSVRPSVILTNGLDFRSSVSHSDLWIGCPYICQSFWLMGCMSVCPLVILIGLDVRQSLWRMDWVSDLTIGCPSVILSYGLDVRIPFWLIDLITVGTSVIQISDLWIRCPFVRQSF